MIDRSEDAEEEEVENSVRKYLTQFSMKNQYRFGISSGHLPLLAWRAPKIGILELEQPPINWHLAAVDSGVAVSAR